MSARPPAAAIPVFAQMRRLAAICLAVLIGLRAWDPPVLAEPRERLFDLYQSWQPRGRVSGKVVVVDIDDASLGAYGQWPWPRHLMARLVEALAAAEPAVIGFTILFPEPDRLAPQAIIRSLPAPDPALAAGLARLPSGDALLAQSFASVPVVLGLATGQAVTGPVLPLATDAGPAAWLEAHVEPLANLPLLAAASTGTGVVTLGTAYDRMVRQLPGAVRIAGEVVPALALEMARIGRGGPPLRLVEGSFGLEALVVGDLAVPSDSWGRIRLAYGPVDDRPAVSAAAVLSGEVARESLAGSSVLVGTSAVGLAERYLTPLGTRLPGLAIHAAFLEGVLTGETLRRPALTGLGECGLALLFGALALLMARRRRTATGLAVLGGAAAATSLGSAFAYREAGFLLDPLFPILAVAAMAALLLGTRLAAARQAAEAGLREREARLKELQSKLLSLSRLGAMQQLSSALAHELNQPLAAIGNYVQASRKLLEGAGEGGLGRVQGHLDKAIAQVERAGAIVVGLRDIVERGETARKPEDVNDTVAEAASSALVGTNPSAAKVTMTLAADLPAALINRIQVQQVVLNLVRNAVEAMADEPRRELVIATSRESAGTIAVAVSDSGPGLAPDVAARLFEPFVSSKMAGMGIGLAISRSIVEAHGGRLMASRNPDRGMTFRFTLPVAAADPEQADGLKPAGAP